MLNEVKEQITDINSIMKNKAITPIRYKPLSQDINIVDYKRSATLTLLDFTSPEGEKMNFYTIASRGRRLAIRFSGDQPVYTRAAKMAET